MDCSSYAGWISLILLSFSLHNYYIVLKNLSEGASARRLKSDTLAWNAFIASDSLGLERLVPT